MSLSRTLVVWRTATTDRRRRTHSVGNVKGEDDRGRALAMCCRSVGPVPMRAGGSQRASDSDGVGADFDPTAVDLGLLRSMFFQVPGPSGLTP